MINISIFAAAKFVKLEHVLRPHEVLELYVERNNTHYAVVLAEDRGGYSEAQYVRDIGNVELGDMYLPVFYGLGEP